MDNSIAIELKGISKSFGSQVKANDHIDLQIRHGEILSVLGENGCGKTTLMNIIAGIYLPDEGTIYIDGKEAVIKSPVDAFNYKIGMIHQHFKLVDILSAADNIILGEKMPTFAIKKHCENIKNEYNGKVKELDPKDKKTKIKKVGIALASLLRICALPFIKIEKWIAFNHLSRNRAKKMQEMATKYGFDIDLKKKIYDMSVSEKQTVEIIKVLYRGANVLILDEPTAVLTPQEIKKLFDVLRNMKKHGKSVVIITHKLNEVMEISDRIVVLRKGKLVASVLTEETDEKKLTEMMVGAKVDLNIVRKTPVNTKPRLVIDGLNIRNKEGIKVIDNASFVINGGEILGIAGIAGNGQKELLEGIAGLQTVESGAITFYNPKKNKPVTFFHKDLKQIKKMAEEGYFHYPDGTKVDFTGKTVKEITKLVNDEQVLFYEDEVINLRERTPREIQELGIKLSFVPEDRLNMGLIGDMSIIDNMMLRSYRKGKSFFVNRKRPKKLADDIIAELEVATPSDTTPVRRLSGGNVQKVLVGREISSSPKVLMAAYPVRGLDINASHMIYKLLNEQKENNVAVIFVGEDLDTLIALCDRILVLCGGKITGIVDGRTANKEEIGLLMTNTHAATNENDTNTEECK